MRYVKLKTTVTKVVDEIIDDKETIIEILNVLKKKELDCVIRLLDGPKLEKTRIVSIGDNDFKVYIIRKYGTLKKTIQFEHLDYLEVNTQDDVIERTKPNISRWTLLDPSAADLTIAEHKV